MKVDLYELERKERESIAWGDNQRRHHVRSAPEVTLALIARIRELEDALSVFHDNVYEHRVVAVLEKGVVGASGDRGVEGGERVVRLTKQ